MRYLVFLIIFTLIYVPVFARTMTSLAHKDVARLLSPQRAFQNSYQDSILDFQQLSQKLGIDIFWDKSALDSATLFSQLRYNKVPVFESYEKLLEIFQQIRDERFLIDPDRTGVKRRLTWLYPDDGCYLRAESINERLALSGYPMGAKVFIFGDLEVESAYGPPEFDGNACAVGKVFWWYHVAVIVSDGLYNYVLDPSLDFFRPLKLEEWILKMVGSPEEATFSICNPYAHEPSSPCDEKTSETAGQLEKMLDWFLSFERARMAELNRDADFELGEHPPWAWNEEEIKNLSNILPICSANDPNNNWDNWSDGWPGGNDDWSDWNYTPNEHPFDRKLRELFEKIGKLKGNNGENNQPSDENQTTEINGLTKLFPQGCFVMAGNGGASLVTTIILLLSILIVRFRSNKNRRLSRFSQ